MDRLTSIQTQFGAKEKNMLDILRERHPLKDQLKVLLYEKKYADLIKQCFDVILQNRHIFQHGDIEDYSRQHERQRSVKMLLTYHRLRPFQASRYFEDPHSLSITGHALFSFDPGLSVKTDISFLLYGKTIINFGKSQLHKQIARDCLSLKDIGCFGLTQLGHGSNVKGIQTQATYDHQTKQFIINSPQKSSMKFWIGAASQMANMAVIWAQLIVDGKGHGPHPFVVPIRNRKTHDLLPGVTIGDCGHKNGCNNIDNGYIMFENVRIPKQLALDLISGVNSETGKFWSVVENPDKLFGMYMNPLSLGRCFVAANTSNCAINALTIAIRYTAQRRQFTGPKETQEKIILEYPLTQYRLMPLLSRTLVYLFGGVNILRLYNKHANNLLDPKHKLVGQMHAISGVTKARASWSCLQTITECRQMLGGHGYSAYSRLGRLFNDVDVNTTWEGDNHMLLQQTTKYILKSVSKLERGKLFAESMLSFLKQNIELPEFAQITSEKLSELSFLKLVLQNRVGQLVRQTMAHMFKLKSQQKSDMEIWNSTQPHYGKKLAFAFSDLYYFDNIISKLAESPNSISPELTEVLHQCIRIWVLDTLQKDRWGTLQLRKIIQTKVVDLCAWLTPRSISLIDIIAPPSGIIGSPFADENGEGMKKYQNMLFTGKKTFQRVDWFDKVIEYKRANQMVELGALGGSQKN